MERRERRLEGSAYNEEYRRWRTERMPRYLQEKSKGQKLKTIEPTGRRTRRALEKGEKYCPLSKIEVKKKSCKNSK